MAVMLAVAVNIMSNLVAVAWLGLGLQGAAATTVATQVRLHVCLVDIGFVKSNTTGFTPLALRPMCFSCCVALQPPLLTVLLMLLAGCSMLLPRACFCVFFCHRWLGQARCCLLLGAHQYLKRACVELMPQPSKPLHLPWGRCQLRTSAKTCVT